MSDLMELLRRNAPCDHADIDVDKVFCAAAEEIERLRRAIRSAVNLLTPNGYYSELDAMTALNALKATIGEEESDG